MSKYPIVYHSDGKYLQYLIPSITSVVSNSKMKKDLIFHIIHQFTEKEESLFRRFVNNSHKDVEFVLYKVDRNLLDTLEVPKNYYRLLRDKVVYNLYDSVKSEYSPEIDFRVPPVFFHILHPYLLTEGKYVYLNCDTIVLKDITELFSIPLGDKVLGSCEDWCVNSLPLNIINWKDYGFDPTVPAFNPSVYVGTQELNSYFDEMFNHTLKNPVYSKMAMQYSANVLLYGKWFRLPRNWNYPVKRIFTKDGKMERYSHEKFNKLRENLLEPFILHFNTIITNSNIMDNFYIKDYWFYFKLSRYSELVD